MAEREPTLVTPFWVRIATETSLSPGWLLIAFPAVLYPTYLLLEVLFGRGLAAATDFGGDYEARLLLLIAIALGYISLTYTYVSRGTFRDLEALRPAIRGGEPTFAGLQHEFSSFERRRLWIGALAGVALTLVMQEVMVARWTRLFAEEWSLRDGYHASILIVFWLVGGSGTMYLIDSARLYSRIGEQHVVVDLLNLHPLLPLTRHGLRIVLCIVMSTAAVVIVLTVNPASAPRSMILTLTICFWNAVLSAMVLVLPVRGLRRQIQARKAEELERVREDIRCNRELAAESGAESAEAGAKLPGLLAYMNQIDSVREWPFDAPTLTRFFLYVAIPLGSWVGGALVERLLSAALD